MKTRILLYIHIKKLLVFNGVLVVLAMYRIKNDGRHVKRKEEKFFLIVNYRVPSFEQMKATQKL